MASPMVVSLNERFGFLSASVEYWTASEIVVSLMACSYTRTPGESLLLSEEGCRPEVRICRHAGYELVPLYSAYETIPLRLLEYPLNIFKRSQRIEHFHKSPHEASAYQ